MEVIIKDPSLANQDTKDNNKIMTLILVFYIFRVMRLVMIIIIISYFVGAFWYFVSW